MVEQPAPRLEWPSHLHPGAVRFAYASSHYDDTIAFYRDVVGLPVVGDFTGSFGEDGTIFGLPGVRTHLEIVRARGPKPADALDQIVFYLSGTEAAAAAAARLDAAGTPRDDDPHPYWKARGALIYVDPDGRRVVFAPWVFGLEPEPGAD